MLFGNIHYMKGDYDRALDNYSKGMDIGDELGNKLGVGASLNNIGVIYYIKGDYDKGQDYLEKSLAIQKEIGLGGDDLIWTNTYLYLTYKHLGKQYDVNEIHTLIKEVEFIEFELNLRL